MTQLSGHFIEGQPSGASDRQAGADVQGITNIHFVSIEHLGNFSNSLSMASIAWVKAKIVAMKRVRLSVTTATLLKRCHCHPTDDIGIYENTHLNTTIWVFCQLNNQTNQLLTARTCIIQQFNSLKVLGVIHRNLLIHTLNHK